MAKARVHKNEIGNFIKSVLPRLTSKPAQDALASLNVSMHGEDGDMRDIIDIYSEVAEKTKSLTKDQKIAVTEGLAGKIFAV
ncbi:phage tail tape measure protein [Peribacillus asahii]